MIMIMTECTCKELNFLYYLSHLLDLNAKHEMQNVFDLNYLERRNFCYNVD